MKLDDVLKVGAIFLVAIVGACVGIIISGLSVGVDTESGARLTRAGASLSLAFTTLLLINTFLIVRRRAKHT